MSQFSIKRTCTNLTSNVRKGHEYTKLCSIAAKTTRKIVLLPATNSYLFEITSDDPQEDPEKLLKRYMAMYKNSWAHEELNRRRHVECPRDADKSKRRRKFERKKYERDNLPLSCFRYPQIEPNAVSCPYDDYFPADEEFIQGAGFWESDLHKIQTLPSAPSTAVQRSVQGFGYYSSWTDENVPSYFSSSYYQQVNSKTESAVGSNDFTSFWGAYQQKQSPPPSWLQPSSTNGFTGVSTQRSPISSSKAASSPAEQSSLKVKGQVSRQANTMALRSKQNRSTNLPQSDKKDMNRDGEVSAVEKTSGRQSRIEDSVLTLSTTGTANSNAIPARVEKASKQSANSHQKKVPTFESAAGKTNGKQNGKGTNTQSVLNGESAKGSVPIKARIVNAQKSSQLQKDIPSAEIAVGKSVASSKQSGRPASGRAASTSGTTSTNVSMKTAKFTAQKAVQQQAQPADIHAASLKDIAGFAEGKVQVANAASKLPVIPATPPPQVVVQLEEVPNKARQSSSVLPGLLAQDDGSNWQFEDLGTPPGVLLEDLMALAERDVKRNGKGKKEHRSKANAF